MNGGTISIVISSLCAAGIVLAGEPTYELNWYTIDGGGAMKTSGGAFEVSGTIGQPDTGPVLVGGSFALAGGFWAVAAGAPCSTVADCADLDGDGIRDDGCTWWACDAGACVGTAVVYADYGGLNGACPPDGTADGNDRFHALNCFGNTNTTGVAGYPCEDDPPQAYNVDAAGLGAPCSPDGVCDGNDVFAALNAFGGVTTCACSAGAAPSGSPSEATVAADVALGLRASGRRLKPGAILAVDVVLDGALDDVRGYQLHLRVNGGTRGRLRLRDIAVEPRDDTALVETWSAFNTTVSQMVAGVDGPARDVPGGAYLATFTYEVSPEARGEFVIGLGERTILFREPFVGDITSVRARPAVVRVVPEGD